jgi:hypothetical protein
MTRLVKAERQLPVAPPPLGMGWRDLVVSLNRRLWCLDPPARAIGTFSVLGHPVVVLYDPLRRAETRAMCDEVEAAFFTTCEMCGDPGVLRSGVVVSVSCDRCWLG